VSECAWSIAIVAWDAEGAGAPGGGEAGTALANVLAGGDRAGSTRVFMSLHWTPQTPDCQQSTENR
jgi:hypothetical protein